MVRRDGSIVWVQDAAVTVIEGDRRSARGFVIDITQRRETELELERQNEQLRQLDSLKDEFVALVSHELRTPLTSIRGYLELMNEDRNLTAEQLRFLETIERNAQRLERVVGDLLFCAQVEAGTLSLETGDVDINAIGEAAVHAAQPSPPAKTIAIPPAPGALPTLPRGRARPAPVLPNLISPAANSTPPAGSSPATAAMPLLFAPILQ